LNHHKGWESFDYRFTYENLRKIGFNRKCDLWWREYLLVPKTNTFVRLNSVRTGLKPIVLRSKKVPHELCSIRIESQGTSTGSRWSNAMYYFRGRALFVERRLLR
jgi:hypothetical protein